MDAISLIFSSPFTWIAVAVSTLYYLYRNGTSTFNYFSDQGIPGPKPLPFIGSMWGLWRENMPKHDIALVKKYGKTFGYFDGQLPNLWTTDAELIRSVFIKDFDHFVNRRNVPLSTKFVRKFMSIMRGQEWKDVRSSVTPVFTTGKIKRMSKLIKECADRLAIKFDKIAMDKGKFNAKFEFSAFTMDVIARCAFGMTIENLGEKDDPFLSNAKKIFSPPGNKSPLILVPVVFPKLMDLAGKFSFGMKQLTFFFDILKKMIAERSETNEKYHDFIEVATESIMEYTNEESDGKKVAKWTREEVDEIVIAQSALFLLAGYDTTATTLTNSCFMLARNPEVQEKLYDDIIEKLDEHGEIGHEMVLDFPYVDNVIHEVLRMNPPAFRVERECNKDVTYNNIKIKKGTVVTVPAFALHYDADYYPEPEVFNPDRWSTENKANMNPNAYMPFGMGPRNCVGMRFAMEEIKIALCTIVKNFRFFPVAETPEKIEYEDGIFSIVQPINATVGIANREQ